MPSLLRCEIGDSLLDLQRRKLARHRLEVRRRHASPIKCRLNAERCLRLAKRARKPEMRQNLTALAGTWPLMRCPWLLSFAQ